uniref:Retrovirus-related Pol polyprotein from transposon TNT 1-94 n=1 Tax=Tanacetum cinerariifolium TaxID=118510 RepID=A0A6L2KGF2_TANCI|nr:retrovirus-related Pol polyprotein from transposon TNT 1-94 [Tanacetum cinerariifolium]
MICTRPNIAHAVGVMGQYMAGPGREHWEGRQQGICGCLTSSVHCLLSSVLHVERYLGEAFEVQFGFPFVKYGLFSDKYQQFKSSQKVLCTSMLHELNGPSQKLLDLAYKFQIKNDEQARITTIVNATKNRSERESHVVKNQETSLDVNGSLLLISGGRSTDVVLNKYAYLIISMRRILPAIFLLLNVISNG